MTTLVPLAPAPAAHAEAVGASTPTDANLVARIRAGDDRAFEALYERYHRRIAAYVFGMVKDHGRAEDVAQEVFLSALRRIRDTDRPIAFKPWLYEIAKNACIDQFRRSRRTDEVSFDAEEGPGSADVGRLACPSPTPDVAVANRMTLDHLCGAFGGLSRAHHEILVLRELEGLSYREIGERMGMSRPAVESTLFRARRRLTEEYEELVSGERCLRVQQIIGAATRVVPGARDQRRLAAHLSHCQPCRRHARVAGLDAAMLVPGRIARVAAFLPIPLFLRRRLGVADVAALPSGPTATAAQWTAQLSAVADPAVAGWAKVAAAAATIAVAGFGVHEVTAPAPDRVAPAAPQTAEPVAKRPAPAAKSPAAPARATGAPAPGIPARPPAPPAAAPGPTTGGPTVQSRPTADARTPGAPAALPAAPADVAPPTPAPESFLDPGTYEPPPGVDADPSTRVDPIVAMPQVTEGTAESTAGLDDTLGDVVP